MKYEILNEKGNVINTILADLACVEKNYKYYRKVEEPAIVPPKKFILTRYEFRSLFTFDEMVAITTAAKTDVVIEVFMKSMEVAEEIDLQYQETASGLGYLVANKFITQKKMNSILKGF